MSPYNASTLLISAALLIFSFYNYRKTKQLTIYSSVDTLYFELLKIGMDYPDFRNPEYTCDYETKFTKDDEKAKYEIYAFMALNICESIFDSEKHNTKIFTTWEPVLHCESRLHKRWLDKEENKIKFKGDFIKYFQKQEGSNVMKDHDR